jgi:hypothetical protein
MATQSIVNLLLRIFRWDNAMNGPMHDWTLHSIIVDWPNREVIFRVSWNKQDAAIFARGFSHLQVPRLDEWGRSVSINGVNGPTPTADNRHTVSIEMQSGDVISVTAAQFEFPAAVDSVRG